MPTSISKTITLLTSGTRGDVQPYIALGLGLQARGQHARIAAPASFAPWVEQAGLPFVALEGNPSELMMSRAGSQALLGGNNVLGSLRASLKFMRDARPIYWRMLSSAWQACRGSDMLLVGLPSLWGVHIAEALGIPCVGAAVQPLTPTRYWPSAILPVAHNRTSTSRWQSWYNRATHAVVAQAMWQPWRGLINQWRRTQLGLGALGVLGPRLSDLPMLYGFSQQVVPRPADWPTQHRITGYWREMAPQAWAAPATLQNFLAGKQPTLYIGFGSPGLPDFARQVQKMIEASQRIDARTIIMLPDGEAQPAVDPTQTLFIREVPHDWLFPQVSAIVHHGGAGTMAAALHAGKPMLVLPRAVDQYFWASRTLLLGIAPTFIPQRQLGYWSIDRLASTFQSLLTHTRFSSNAQVVGENLSHEQGVQTALDVLATL